MLKVIIDFDGTITAEEEQAVLLVDAMLASLADEIIGAPRAQLTADYQAVRACLQQNPRQYRWIVNGLVASYCDEGAFILNTTTVQTMLKEKPAYLRAVQAAYPQPEYDAVIDCTNDLFHRHTAVLPLTFRPAAKSVLTELIEHPQRRPIILTNSLGAKVKRHIATLGLAEKIDILGDTRQYDMSLECPCRFPTLGKRQIWTVAENYEVDLRRPDYYQALLTAAADGSQLVVVADTFSLPGAMPLMMGIPFILTRVSYTPDWCLQAVADHPLGVILDDLADLPAALDNLP
ncbi:MAG: hypothetical protein GY803_11440 [Chloroflexi bacterium]|nr:hypothetical protein [Chloroflexota bacterium]